MQFRTVEDDVVAVELDVGPEHVPGMVLEHVAPRRLRLVVGDAPLLWARLDDCLFDVGTIVSRASDSPSVLPPLRAEEARARRGPAAWLTWVADGLRKSARAPLRYGSWQLTWYVPRMARRVWPLPQHYFAGYASADPDHAPPIEDLLASVRRQRVHWEPMNLNGARTVHPLRVPSPPDAPRVKAWRKHASAATLPPIVLWWVDPLSQHLVLDGHDRLSAAAAEGTRPDVVVLWQCRYLRPEDTHDRRSYIEGYEQAHARSTTPLETKRALNRSLADWHRPVAYPLTTSVHRPRHAERWRREVRAALGPGHDHLAAFLG